MSKKKTHSNRKSGNAGKKRGGSTRNRSKSKANLRQGKDTSSVKGQRLFDDARMKGTKIGNRFDHARPIENRKGAKHPRHKQNKPRGAREVKTPPGNYPREKPGDGKKWVPWVEVNISAQVHHYAFVIREMLEGSHEKPELGTPQLDLHGRDGSVESVLTQTPRLRRDWRTFVGVLRLLHEDNYIPASFVEKMLSRHPLTGARSVKVVVDESVEHDYVRDKCVMSNKRWVSEARTSFVNAKRRIKELFIEGFIEEQRRLIPDLTDEQYLKAAETAWKNDEPTVVGLKTDDGFIPCADKEAYIKAHMVKRARKDAVSNPTLYRMSGGVRYETMEKNEITQKSDFVNIEFAVLNTGKVWIAVCNGNKKSTNSPFRKHYLRMVGNSSELSFIDDVDVPREVNHSHIQRPVMPVQPVITDDMSVVETLKILSKQGNVNFDDARFRKPKRESKPKHRVVPPRRGRRGVKRPKNESPEGDEGGAR